MNTKEKPVAKRPTLAFFLVIIFAFLLYYLMLYSGEIIKSNTYIFDYATWQTSAAENAWYRFLWIIGDMTEPLFFKALFGGVFLLLGALLAFFLDKKRVKFRGTPISYGTGLWPWIFFASIMSLILSNIFYGNLLRDTWLPTFVPFVCVAGGIILIYGGTLINALTGAVLGAVATTPISIFVMETICLPAGLPVGIGSVTGMCVGSIICFEVCHILPWMKKKTSPATNPASIPGEMTPKEMKFKKPNQFFVRRIFADYSEPMFIGNEITGFAIILGCIITWILNPQQPAYGSGLFPALLLAGLLTEAISIFLYWDQWLENDWFPSFISAVSVAPGMILFFGASIPVIIIGAVVGAILCPPVANLVLRHRPAHWHNVVAFTLSMSINMTLVTLFIKFLNSMLPIY